MARKQLDAVDVIQRVITSNEKDLINPLLKYIGISESDLSGRKDKTREDAEKIISLLCKAGSNDFATLFRGGQGVKYSEVVFDVAKHLGVDGASKDSITEKNEELIILKIFADLYDGMTEDEKKELLTSFNADSAVGDIPWTASGTIIAQLLLKQFGGFSTYKISLIVANAISRAILGAGLSFATNAAITRGISLFLGPVGWGLTGAWLAIEVAGPAYRKTIPAVITVAMLRQLVVNNISIGVLGEGSVGKDSLFKAVFNIDTGNINAKSGATRVIEEYRPAESESISIKNFPGDNDIDESVNLEVADQKRALDIAVLVVDIDRGVSGDDVKSLGAITDLNLPVIVCLNKIDKLRPEDKDAMVMTAKERLVGASKIIETAFDPDPRLHSTGPIGTVEILEWIATQLELAGKSSDQFIKFFSKT